jgi:hypothetical protein
MIGYSFAKFRDSENPEEEAAAVVQTDR